MIKKNKVVNYPVGYNPIVDYWKWMQANPTQVSLKIYKVYQELFRLLNDDLSEWEYSEVKANHALAFVETFCHHSKGKAFGGKAFILELWESALVAATFGFIHKIDGTRKYTEVMLNVARKNGKSTLSAAIGLYMMVADNEPGAEIYAVATKRDQAKIIWLEAKRMVKKSPVLAKRIKTLVAELVADFCDSYFKPLGSDSDTQDGLNVHCALLDEIHAWKDRNLYDVIVDGSAAREEPLIFITTTAGTVRQGVYDIKYDEAERVVNGYGDDEGYKNEKFLPLIYELDNRLEWKDPSTWVKANPGLGTIKQLGTLAAKVKKAESNAMLVKNLLCKDFNIRETTSDAWLTFDQLNNEEVFNIAELKPRYGIGGVDLSITTDLTAAVLIFMVPGNNTIFVKSMFWLPEDLLETRDRDDKIPYIVWRDQGFLRTTPGNKVDYHYVTEWFKEVQAKDDIYIAYVGYDNYSAGYFVKEMKMEFGDEPIECVIQGAKTLSGPMRSLGADLSANRINYNNNPILKWCLSNVSFIEDRNANILPCKTSNVRRRIDGFAALLDAYVILEKHQDEYSNMI